MYCSTIFNLDLVFSKVFTLYYSKLPEVVCGSGLISVREGIPLVVFYLPRGSFKHAGLMFPHDDCLFSSRKLIRWSLLRVCCLQRGDHLFLMSAMRTYDVDAGRGWSVFHVAWSIFFCGPCHFCMSRCSRDAVCCIWTYKLLELNSIFRLLHRRIRTHSSTVKGRHPSYLKGLQTRPTTYNSIPRARNDL